jgi:hypothetical protein
MTISPPLYRWLFFEVFSHIHMRGQETARKYLLPIVGYVKKPVGTLTA